MLYLRSRASHRTVRCQRTQRPAVENHVGSDIGESVVSYQIVGTSAIGVRQSYDKSIALFEDFLRLICADLLTLLWNQHAAALQLMARARCATPEDCVQEAFVRLAKQDKLPDDPMAWLVRVTRNEAISRWRSESIRKAHESRFATERPSWFATNTETEDRPGNNELQMALSQLEPDCREIVIAHIWGKLTFRQIADSFELSNSSAHRQYVLGIAKMKEWLSART